MCFLFKIILLELYQGLVCIGISCESYFRLHLCTINPSDHTRHIKVIIKAYRDLSRDSFCGTGFRFYLAIEDNCQELQVCGSGKHTLSPLCLASNHHFLPDLLGGLQ